MGRPWAEASGMIFAPKIEARLSPIEFRAITEQVYSVPTVTPATTIVEPSLDPVYVFLPSLQAASNIRSRSSELPALK